MLYRKFPEDPKKDEEKFPVIFETDLKKWLVDNIPSGNGITEPNNEKYNDPANSFKKYTESVLAEHRHLPSWCDGVPPVPLKKVFVNMNSTYYSGSNQWDIDAIKEHIDQKRESFQDIKNAFEASRHFQTKDMMIVGGPGSGKTTLLKYIIISLIEGEGQKKLSLQGNIVPFFAPLIKVKNHKDESLIEFIMRVCCLENYSISRELLEDILSEGRGIILLDGLDEVADKDERRKICRWIDREKKKFTKTWFVVTSRYTGYAGKNRLESPILELSIQNFTPEQRKKFLINWFESVEWKKEDSEDALSLIERIEKSDHLEKLAVNPLLLQIMAVIHRIGKKGLPDHKVKIYKEYIKILLENMKGTDICLTAEAKKILQPLAFWLHNKEGRIFAPLEDLVHGIKPSLNEMGKSDTDLFVILQNIGEKSRILVRCKDREYGFNHLSFQEYFVALHIRDTRQIDILLSNYGKKWWREVIIISLTLDNPSIIEEFSEQLIISEKLSCDENLIKDAIADSVVKPTKPFIDSLFNKQLHLQVKISSIHILTGLPEREVTEALKKTVTGEDQKLAISAYEALELRGEAKGLSKPVDKDIHETVVNSIDDSQMALVPSGVFIYGSKEDDHHAGSDEKPQATLNLPAFYIDLFLVTNAQYCQFLNDTNPHSLRDLILLDGVLKYERSKIKRVMNQYMVKEGYGKHPVTYVSKKGAEKYAKWAGKRIPTEYEWEKAARGPQGNIFPWGNEFNRTLCNSAENGINETTEVKNYNKIKSYYGCFDMAGNVWEWTDSRYDYKSLEMFYVLRGGSWSTNKRDCRTSKRLGFFSEFKYSTVGFRCVKNLPC